MVLLGAQFRSKHRSLVRRARVEKIRVVKLQEDLYYAARQTEGHDRYLIYLNHTKTGLFANCRTIRGAACGSFGCCTHICAVFERMMAELNKKERSTGERSAA